MATTVKGLKTKEVKILSDYEAALKAHGASKSMISAL